MRQSPSQFKRCFGGWNCILRHAYLHTRTDTHGGEGKQSAVAVRMVHWEGSNMVIWDRGKPHRCLLLTGKTNKQRKCLHNPLSIAGGRELYRE